jgi:hypothetical protein
MRAASLSKQPGQPSALPSRGGIVETGLTKVHERSAPGGRFKRDDDRCFRCTWDRLSERGDKPLERLNGLIDAMLADTPATRG